MEPTDLQIAVTPLRGGWARIDLRGELDLSAAPWFGSRLIDEVDAADGVLLDLSGVDFVDSTGLALIMAGLRHAEAAGTRLEFVDPLPPQAHRLLEISGLLPRLVLRAA